MTNTINLLKGFAFALFGFLGIHINIEAEMLHIMVKEGSVSWYLLEIIPVIFLLIGLYNIYQFALNFFHNEKEKVIKKSKEK